MSFKFLSKKHISLILPLLILMSCTDSGVNENGSASVMGAHLVDPDYNSITDRLSVKQNDEWINVSTDFIYPDNISTATVLIWAQGREEDETLYGWVDDVRIEITN